MDSKHLREAREKYLRLDATEQAWVEEQYKRAGRELRVALRKLGERIAKEGADPNLVSQQARVETLIRQTQEELRVLAGKVDERTTLSARLAAEDAMYAARDTVPRAPTSVFGQFNAEAVMTAATATTENTRLAVLLEQRLDQFATEVRSQIVQGIVQGKGPNEMARIAEKAIGKQGWNARCIMRTEMSRAHNDAARFTYGQMGVAEYQWLSAGDARTCASCLALHGKRFKTDEERPAHPACRCTIVPVLDGLKPIPNGETVLKRMSAVDQMKVLGPGRYQKWKNEGLPLAAMTRTKTHPVWGPSEVLIPLSSLP